jgi:hypothetical protein
MTKELEDTQNIQSDKVVGVSKYTWLIVTVLTVFVLYAAILLLAVSFGKNLSIEKSGVFGDSFGALTALFSGLAFAGMMITVLLQRDELALQRQELQLTRGEMQNQRAQMVQQNKTLAKQTFENTFFELLKMQNEITSSIDLSTESDTWKGRDCFRKMYLNFCSKYKARKISNSGLSSVECVNSAYDAFYDEHQASIGHYYRGLYNLVRFVEDTEDIDKRLFMNLVRAQLSTYELLLLFYNCLSSHGLPLKRLAMQYDLLKALEAKLLPDYDLLISAYTKTEENQSDSQQPSTPMNP